MLRIVMAVANSGSEDPRVAKSANIISKKGFDVHVVCISKNTSSFYEKIDGVSYHKMSKLGIFGKNNNISFFFSPLKIFFFLKPFLLVGKIFFNLVIKIYLKITNKNFVKVLFQSYFNIFFKKLLELNGDIYYAHELWTLESCYIVSKKILKKKLIYDSHELELHRNNLWSAKANRDRIGYEKKYIEHVDHVLAVSEGCAKIIENHYNLKHKVTIVRNTPLLSDLKKSNNSLRKKINIKKNEKLLVYTGLSSYSRGLDFLINSMKYLQTYHLATVGSWDIDYKKKIQILINKNKLSDRIHMLPPVPRNELINFISSADYSVIPIIDTCLSYKYCLPNKLFEAAFAGLPIISSDLPDMKKVIIKNNLGCVFKVNDLNSFLNCVSKAKKLRKKINYSFIQKVKFEAEMTKVINLINNFNYKVN
jgi:glycosyltransferase involved in cell wall biosynthesis